MVTSRRVPVARRTWPRYLAPPATVLFGMVVGFSAPGHKPAVAAIAALAVGLVAPRWSLLTAAIVAQHLLPEFRPLAGTFVGELLVSDILLFAFLLRWLAWRVSKAADSEPAEPTRGPTRTQGWLIAFFVWAWFDLVATGSFGTGTSLARITLYGVAYLAASTDRALGRPVLVSVALYASLEAVLAAVGLTPFASSRALGFYGDPGILSVLILAGIACSTVLPRWIRNSMMPVLLLGIILSETRGATIATLVQLTLIAMPSIRRHWLRMGVVALIIAAVGFALARAVTEQLSLNPNSIALRTASWGNALEMIASKPLLGLGWAGRGSFSLTGIVPGVRATVPPFNTWLYLAATTGIIGAGLFLVFSIEVLRTLSSSNDRVAQAGGVYVVGFMVVALGEMLLYPGPPALEFFVISGSCVALCHAREDYSGSPRGGHGSRAWPVLPPPR